jgi:ribulose-phosphate 3-epimerase
MEIIPVILAQDSRELRRKIKISEGLVSKVQLDIVDGRFAPNLTVMPKHFIRFKTKLNLQIHLMCFKPEQYVLSFAQIGAKEFIFHIESTKNPDRVIEIIKSKKMEPGIALLPKTRVHSVRKFIKKVKLVLILTVHPGFSGQHIIPEYLQKIKEVRKINPKAKIILDGGINEVSIPLIKKFKPDFLAVGNALWKEKDFAFALKKLKKSRR